MEISGIIVDRINKIMNVRHITQSRLVEMCQSAGYSISQPEVSKILSGKSKPTVFFLVALGEVLGVSLDYLTGGGRSESVLMLEGKNFAVDPGVDEEFQNITGEYWVYYETTDPYDDKVLTGELYLENNGAGYCEARLCIHTGEYRDGSEVDKNYKGQLVISHRMRAAYCFLYSSKVAEICLVLFRYRSFAIREMTCRLGMAVTMSSGEKKMPTAHKLLITREKLDKKALNMVIPYLRFQTEGIRISEYGIADAIEKYPEYEKQFSELLRIARRSEQMVINEDDIRLTDRKLSQIQVAQLKSILIRESDALRNVKLVEEEDSQVFYLILNLLERAEKSTKEDAQ